MSAKIERFKLMVEDLENESYQAIFNLKQNIKIQLLQIRRDELALIDILNSLSYFEGGADFKEVDNSSKLQFQI